MSNPPECATIFFLDLRSILVVHFGLQSVSYQVETPCIIRMIFLGKDTCRGDSGGPLVLKLGQYKTYYQMGIVSFGFEGICGNGRPAIYTRLASYLEWIQASLEP